MRQWVGCSMYSFSGYLLCPLLALLESRGSYVLTFLVLLGMSFLIITRHHVWLHSIAREWLVWRRQALFKAGLACLQLLFLCRFSVSDHDADSWFALIWSSTIQVDVSLCKFNTVKGSTNLVLYRRTSGKGERVANGNSTWYTEDQTLLQRPSKTLYFVVRIRAGQSLWECSSLVL